MADPGRSICIYCSSSDAVDDVYFQAADLLGSELGRRGHRMVYGGTDVGLMGAASRAARRNGASVVGVIPESIRDKGIAATEIDELIVTADLRERKAVMERRADAFIALPGGFGTLEELLEVMTLRQLRTHSKPIVLLNVHGFFNPLIDLFEHLYASRFAKPDHRAIYSIAAEPDEALDLAGSAAVVDIPDKWFNSPAEL